MTPKHIKRRGVWIEPRHNKNCFCTAERGYNPWVIGRMIWIRSNAFYEFTCNDPKCEAKLYIKSDLIENYANKLEATK